MEVIIAASVILTIFIGSISIALNWEERRRLQNSTKVDLEEEAYRYEYDYFLYIGEGNDDVQEFRLLVERKDLDGLMRNWKRLKRSFRKLEWDAGHRGRPLIMEHYDYYDLVLKELSKRRNQRG